MTRQVPIIQFFSCASSAPNPQCRRNEEDEAQKLRISQELHAEPPQEFPQQQLPHTPLQKLSPATPQACYIGVITLLIPPFISLPRTTKPTQKPPKHTQRTEPTPSTPPPCAPPSVTSGSWSPSADAASCRRIRSWFRPGGRSRGFRRLWRRRSVGLLDVGEGTGDEGRRG